MIETSGLKPSMSFAEYDHDSRIWRTYQVSLLTLMPDEFTETWPKAGMTVDGVGYLQPKQELRIAEIDGGVLPTPAATEYGNNQSPSNGAAVRPSLSSMARNNLWPTPTKTDGIRGIETNEARKQRGAHTGTTLNDAVAMWPTPCAADGKDEASGDLYARVNQVGRQKGKPTLPFWTPDANCWKGGNRGNQINQQIPGSLNPMWVEWLMGWPIGWTDLEPLEMDRYRQWLEQHGNC